MILRNCKKGGSRLIGRIQIVGETMANLVRDINEWQGHKSIVMYGEV